MNNIKPLVKTVSANDLHADGKKIFNNFLEKNGKVPKWLQVMGNCEDTMVGFYTLFQSVMDNEPVSAKLKWKVAYIVSDINKCEFCIGATQLKLVDLGITEKNLQDIDKTKNEKEALAIEYAKVTTKHAYSIDPELMIKMKNLFSDEEIVEITAVIGTFNFINRFNDALRIF